MPKISLEKIKQLIDSNGTNNPLYVESNKIYTSLRLHADGEFPKDMLQKARPSEPAEIAKYREENYKPVTQLPISQVINAFMKIRHSPDFMIKFETINSSVIPEESLEVYCKERIPGFESIESWAFELLLKQNLIDPNAVVAVLPFEQAKSNVYHKPVPILFNSDQVIGFDVKENWALLRSKVFKRISKAGGQYSEKFIYYYLDDIEVIIFEPDDTDGSYTGSLTIPNPTKMLPVFKVKAVPFKQYDGMVLNRSRLSPMVPFLDEAACEYSDLKGAKIMHLFPLFWYYQDNKCPKCEGAKKVTEGTGESARTVKCMACDGSGKIKFSPFASMAIAPPKLGKTPPPNPPAGYINRDTAILELQDKSIDKHNFRALSAMNMQFLNQTPLSISGDAKNVDRAELQNTVYSVAEDLIYSIEKTIRLINRWRNSWVLNENEEKLRAMEPKIPVPQNFDILPENYLTDELKSARDANVTPFMISVIEQELAEKKFYTRPELAIQVELFYNLDPLPGMTADQKMTALADSTVTQEDYILSNYLAAFLRRAMRENKGFDKLTYQQQMDILTGYVKEKSNALNAAKNAADAARKKLSNPVDPNMGG